nr:MAG TPA: restriction endonuclease [Caudoviricetes sp.]
MMSAYPMKHCNKCSTSKPISEFTKKFAAYIR